MTRIEIPVEDARPGDIAVLRGPRWPTEIEAEVYGSGQLLFAAGCYVRLLGGSASLVTQRIYREVPDLPTESGSVIRATVDGAPDTVAFLGRFDEWFSSNPINGRHWHTPEDIDLSTVRVGRIVFEEDAS
jgi:hypothetical protein